MKILKFILWMSGCLLLSSCITTNVTNSQELGEKVALSNGYTLVVPNGSQIVTVSSGEMDFDVFVLKEAGGKILAKLYLGNAPDTSITKRNRYLFANFKTVSFKGIEQTKVCGTKTCGDFLVYLDDKKGWPQFSHIFFNDLTNDELKIVEGIVHSLTHE